MPPKNASKFTGYPGIRIEVAFEFQVQALMANLGSSELCVIIAKVTLVMAEVAFEFQVQAHGKSGV